MYPIGQFLNIYASPDLSTDKLGGPNSYSPELVNVELNVTLGQVTWLVAKKSAASETKELVIAVPTAQVCWNISKSAWRRGCGWHLSHSSKWSSSVQPKSRSYYQQVIANVLFCDWRTIPKHLHRMELNLYSEYLQHIRGMRPRGFCKVICVYVWKALLHFGQVDRWVWATSTGSHSWAPLFRPLRLGLKYSIKIIRSSNCHSKILPWDKHDEVL